MSTLEQLQQALREQKQLDEAIDRLDLELSKLSQQRLNVKFAITNLKVQLDAELIG